MIHAYRECIWMLRERGDSSAAEAMCREAIELAPGRHEFHLELGILLDGEGRAREASEEYERALRAAPDHPAALLYGSMLRAEQGAHDEAIEMLVRALRNVGAGDAPPPAMIVSVLVQVCTAAKNFDRADREIEELLKSRPADRAALLNQRAIVLSRSDRTAEAVELYEEILKLEPSFGQAHFNIGLARMRQRNYGAALESFRRYAEAAPEDPRSDFGLGYAHQNLGHQELAARHYEAYLRRRRTLPRGSEFRDVTGEFAKAAEEFLSQFTSRN
jgi:tetratricopeptide (TPR) repeat protein